MMRKFRKNFYKVFLEKCIPELFLKIFHKTYTRQNTF